jgi:hypothetical protein
MTQPEEPGLTHAYLGVYDGRARDLILDFGSYATAEQVADVIASGGWVQRFPLAEAYALRGKEISPLISPRAPDLTACEAAARRVA